MSPNNNQGRSTQRKLNFFTKKTTPKELTQTYLKNIGIKGFFVVTL